eukprot:354149-Chlamydomonas_euryale.AAC.1
MPAGKPGNTPASSGGVRSAGGPAISADAWIADCASSTRSRASRSRFLACTARRAWCVMCVL